MSTPAIILMVRFAIFLFFPLISNAQADLFVTEELSADRQVFLSHMPVQFSSNNGPGLIDPFAQPDTPSVTSILTHHGIRFDPGTDADFVDDHTLQVTHTPEIIEEIRQLLPQLSLAVVDKIRLTLEMIEVETELFHEWIYENRINDNGQKLRAQADIWLEGGLATTVDLAVITVLSGNRSKTESARSVIYPTEPGVPELPQTISLSGEESIAPIVAAVPSGYDQREVGTIFEVNPMIDGNEDVVNINMGISTTSDDGLLHWPPTNVDPLFTKSWPYFYMTSCSSQFATRTGHTCLLCTSIPISAKNPKVERPLILTFIRSDIITQIAKPKPPR